MPNSFVLYSSFSIEVANSKFKKMAIPAAIQNRDSIQIQKCQKILDEDIISPEKNLLRTSEKITNVMNFFRTLALIFCLAGACGVYLTVMWPALAIISITKNTFGISVLVTIDLFESLYTKDKWDASGEIFHVFVDHSAYIKSVIRRIGFYGILTEEEEIRLDAKFEKMIRILYQIKEKTLFGTLFKVKMVNYGFMIIANFFCAKLITSNELRDFLSKANATCPEVTLLQMIVMFSENGYVWYAVSAATLFIDVTLRIYEMFYQDNNALLKSALNDVIEMRSEVSAPTAELEVAIVANVYM